MCQLGCSLLLRNISPSPPQINLNMLRSAVEAAEALDERSLLHVFTMEGGKWHG